MIARENKGILGIDYNRSPHVPFTISRSNIHLPATPDDQDEKINEPLMRDISKRIEEEKAAWENETRNKNILIIVGSVIGCLAVIVLATGLTYLIIRRRNLKRTLAAEDGEGKAIYDRMNERCQCDN